MAEVRLGQERGKGRSRKISWKCASIIWVIDDNYLKRNRNDKDHDNLSDSGFTLRVEPKLYANKLDMRYKRDKKKSGMTTLSNWKDKIAICLLEKNFRKSRFKKGK